MGIAAQCTTMSHKVPFCFLICKVRPEDNAPSYKTLP